MHFLPGNIENKAKGLSHSRSPFAFHLPSGYRRIDLLFIYINHEQEFTGTSIKCCRLFSTNK